MLFDFYRLCCLRQFLPSHPPITHSVDLRQGETIRIQTSDDVTVAGVQVVVLDEQGKAVEKGGAIKGRRLVA
jgi:hypothetical protein